MTKYEEESVLITYGQWLLRSRRLRQGYVFAPSAWLPPFNRYFPSRASSAFENGADVFCLTYAILQSIYTIARTFNYVISAEVFYSGIFGACLCWICFACFGVISGCVLWLRRDSMDEMIVEWQRLELLCQQLHSPDCPLKSAFAQKKRRYTQLVKTLFLSEQLMIAVSGLCGIFNCMNWVDSPIYFHKLVQPCLGDWTRFVTCPIQLFYCYCLTRFRCQIYAFYLGLVTSIDMYLNLIAVTHQGEPEATRAAECPTSMLERNLEIYTRLDNLVSKFNGVFKWGLFLNKLLSLVLTCLILFSYIAKREEYVVPERMYLFVAVCIYTSISLAAKGLSFARVYGTSAKVVQRWRLELVKSSSDRTFDVDLWNRVEACRPIGFRSGDLYVIKPTTILTYFYVIITYLIVALQFQELYS